MSTVTLVGIEPDAVVAHFLGQQLLQLEHPEHAGRVDLLAQLLRQHQRAREQLVAFHHGLLARHVEARDHAVLRAGRGVHVEVLAEEVLVEAGIVDVDHRLACENADSTLCVLCVA